MAEELSKDIATPTGDLKLNIADGGKVSAEDAAFIALEMGEKLLMCGAEIARVEDTVYRIALAYGATTIDVMAIMSLIILTVEIDGISITHSRRVTKNEAGNNFGRLERLNALSRRICAEKPSKQEFLSELKKISSETRPRLLFYVLGNILVAAGFTVFFGGSLIDSAIAGFISIVMCLLLRVLVQKLDANEMVSKFTVCFVGGAAAILVSHMGFIPCDSNKIMIGNIMNVISGVAFTNSLRDLLGGDLMTGLFRFASVILDTVSIACGYALAILLLEGALI